VFRSPECPALPDRVAEIYGRQIAGDLVPIEAHEGEMALSGLIGRPGVGRGTRHEMVVFVNRRPVDSRTLNYALIESYHESLPKGRYPLAFVFFDIHPAAVDVNVHPAKREVRFRSEPTVRGFVIRSVLGRLREIATASAPPVPAAPRVAGLTLAPLPSLVAPPAPSIGPVTPPARPATIEPTPPNAPSVPSPTSAAHTPGPRSPATRIENQNSEIVPSGARSLTNPTWRFLGVAHTTYGLFESPTGLVMMDRRAAHERICFERLQEQWSAGSIE